MATFDYYLVDLFSIDTTLTQSVTAFPNSAANSSTITVSQTIEFTRETPNSSEVTVSQSISIAGDIGKTISDSLTITQQLTGVLIYAGRGGSSSGGSAFVDPAAEVIYGSLAKNTTVSFVNS